MAEPGTYKIKYMCKNSHGLEAHTKYRVVIVLPHPSGQPTVCPHPNPQCVPARPGCSYVPSNETEHGCKKFPCGKLQCSDELANCPTLVENYPCNTAACPVDCKVSEWSGFSTCPRSCGTGFRHRTRTVDVHPAHGGKACPSMSEMGKQGLLLFSPVHNLS